VAYQLKVETQCVVCSTTQSGSSPRIHSPRARDPSISGRTKSGAFSSTAIRGVCGVSTPAIRPPVTALSRPARSQGSS
jgi:hypothetical protein